jgi:uncharacterized protein (DUF2147 family)
MGKTFGTLVMISALSVGQGLFAEPALARDPSGVWVRDNGEAKIKVGKCGSAFCGRVIWVKDPKRQGDINKLVLSEMIENGPNSWSGKAFNPLEDKTYIGKMTLSGTSLTTSGCIMGGMMCKDMSWRRSKE